MTFAERVIKARKHAHFNQEMLADAIRIAFDNEKIGQPTISRIETGAKSSEYVVHIAVVCGVRPEWLALGKGPMEGKGSVVMDMSDLNIALAIDQCAEILNNAKAESRKKSKTLPLAASALSRKNTLKEKLKSS